MCGLSFPSDGVPFYRRAEIRCETVGVPRLGFVDGSAPPVVSGTVVPGGLAVVDTATKNTVAT
ncbi:hypothetical protein GCM10010446_40830 [Streptomyces enissocaesilis]|uniref:Uncharacterized protein n=1 Tax=Streptomyces enissocaesilis TaxID=332589 RepID=A0ABP6JZC4_9ACTN